MVTGWRRAFCTSIPKDQRDAAPPPPPSSSSDDKHFSNSNSPRISSKLGFFSNPSTPRPHPVSTLRCRTTAASPASSLPNSPKLSCKSLPATTSSSSSSASKSSSPRFFNFSNPSSPKSPSSFSLLKSTLRLSKSRCGICAHSVKSGQGTAIFTAECNHVFHFPCVTSHFTKHHLLLCPVCNSPWKELPLLSLYPNSQFRKGDSRLLDLDSKSKNLRVYNDDEPLMSPSPGSLFNPIPELEENESELDDDESGRGSSDVEFQGFFVNPSPGKGSRGNHNNYNHHLVVGAKNVDVSLLPESAVVAAVRGYETHVMVMKVRAPPSQRGIRRAPVDLVTVLDVSDRICGVAKSQVMKRAMKLVLASLTGTDRLSIVAFSGGSKRLMPLRRMTTNGRKSARRIVEALVGTTTATGQGMTVNDALKKALKVIEDRRDKNPVATVLILSDDHQDRSRITPLHQDTTSPPALVSATRYSQFGTPVHSISFGDLGTYKHAAVEDAFSKCLGGLLRVVVQDVKIQLGFVTGSGPAEIVAAYPLTGPPTVFIPGSIGLGDLHVDEEREVLLEVRIPSSSSSGGSRRLLSVRSSFKDTPSQEQMNGKEQGLIIPRPQAVRSSRLKNVHVSVRAVAESRRLVEHGDLSGAYHLLSSARALLMQRSDSSAGECLQCVEAELAELQKKKPVMTGRQSQQQQRSQHQLNRQSEPQVEEKAEALTPTSAWRAAEKLAKLAIMRKHMNRVSDLHGFENARF
ncbi:E3 ubiquitin-protein ligase WAVH1 [Linum grandiflorum]